MIISVNIIICLIRSALCAPGLIYNYVDIRELVFLMVNRLTLESFTTASVALLSVCSKNGLLIIINYNNLLFKGLYIPRLVRRT